MATRSGVTIWSRRAWNTLGGLQLIIVDRAVCWGRWQKYVRGHLCWGAKQQRTLLQCHEKQTENWETFCVVFAVCICPQLLVSKYDTGTDDYVADWGQQQWECWLPGCPRYRGGQLAGNILQGTGHWTVDRDAQTIVVAAPAAENVSHLIRAKLFSPHACLL